MTLSRTGLPRDSKALRTALRDHMVTYGSGFEVQKRALGLAIASLDEYHESQEPYHYGVRPLIPGKDAAVRPVASLTEAETTVATATEDRGFYPHEVFRRLKTGGPWERKPAPYREPVPPAE